MTDAELVSKIEQAVSNAIIKNRSNFYIEPKLHYDQHMKFSEFLSNLNDTAKLVRRVVITSLLTSAVGVVITGILFYLKSLK